MPEWPETTLDSCVSLTKGVTYAAADYAEKGQGHPFLTIKSVKKGGGFNQEGLKYYKGPYKPEQAVKPGELLVALTDLTRAGDIIGGPFGVPELGAPVVLPSMDLAVLRAGSEPIDFKYLAYRLMLHDARRYMLARSAGTTVLHLDSKAALKFSFLRPKPRAQKRIAEILSTVDEAIEQTEALIAKTQQIKAGLMHDLFTRGVTPDGQLRPPREEVPQLYKESPLGWIPKEWEVNTIGEKSTKMTNGFVGTATPFYSDESGSVVYLYGNNIRADTISTEKALRVTRAFHGRQLKSQLAAGDMLTVQSGHIGTSAIFPEELGPANCHALIITRFINDSISPNYVSRYLNSDLGMRRMASIFVGSTILHVNTSDLYKFCIPSPDSVDEQIEIVRRLEAIDSVLHLEEENRSVLRQIKNGLMGDLLSGHVEISS